MEERQPSDGARGAAICDGAPVPRSIPRGEHGISRANISPNTLKVLYRLHKHGYEAYLVGGGVRDLLLGREPKDFDVATDARPEEVRALFRNCRLIGRRFRLAHVHFGPEIVEVATFRGSDDDGSGERRVEDGRLVRDNVYGTLDEDAARRDFTVNALYYGIDDFSVLDFAGGYEDIHAGVIRLIGEPERRYREDPVRLLRAVRFAAKLGFRIEPRTEAPMRELGPLLADIAPARLFEEVLKLFLGGHGAQSFELLRHYDLFQYLFPDTDDALAQEHEGFPATLLVHALAGTDSRVSAGRPVTPAFLYAALLWEPMRQYWETLQAEGLPERQALEEAADWVIARQVRHTALPKRFSQPMREIWQLQPRFHHRTGGRAMRLLAHPRFRAAYDFLLLRAEDDEELAPLAQWWTDIQELDPAEQRRRMQAKAGKKKRRGGRRRRRRKSPEHGQ